MNEIVEEGRNTNPCCAWTDWSMNGARSVPNKFAIPVIALTVADAAQDAKWPSHFPAFVCKMRCLFAYNNTHCSLAHQSALSAVLSTCAQQSMAVVMAGVVVCVRKMYKLTFSYLGLIKHIILYIAMCCPLHENTLLFRACIMARSMDNCSISACALAEQHAAICIKPIFDAVTHSRKWMWKHMAACH